MSLCFRCEHRAKFLENNLFRPRYECGDVLTSKYSCYMYQPVKPVILAKDEEDERPQFGPTMLTARSHAVRVAEEMILCIKKDSEGSTLYWGFADVSET